MDNRIIELLSEEIRETKQLVRETKKDVKETRRLAIAAEKKADAAWELVVMTRNQINRPWWKRALGVE